MRKICIYYIWILIGTNQIVKLFLSIIHLNTKRYIKVIFIAPVLELVAPVIAFTTVKHLKHYQYDMR